MRNENSIQAEIKPGTGSLPYKIAALLEAHLLGNAHQVGTSLLEPGNSIAAAIANEFTEADSDIYLSSLIALGFLLFVVTFAVLAVAKILLLRLERQAGA